MHRRYELNNVTLFTDLWVYAVDTLLHELLLQSEHRWGTWCEGCGECGVVRMGGFVCPLPQFCLFLRDDCITGP